MGMAVPLSLSPSKPFTYRNFIRILGLFGIGLFLNLFEVKFNFYECKYLIYDSPCDGNSTKTQLMLWSPMLRACNH